MTINNDFMNSIAQTNQLVSAGSTDGMCAVTAFKRVVKRLTGDDSIQTIFTQAFTVNTLKPETWDADRKVGFIDLAVNNRDSKMTQDFVASIHNAAHQILFIADEHNRADWMGVLGSFDRLLIEPQNRTEEHYSSCAILKQAFEANGVKLSEEEIALLKAGDEADHGDTSSAIASVFDKAAKINLRDNNMRLHLVENYTNSMVPNETISKKIAEYEVLEANHKTILEKKEDLSHGIVSMDANAAGPHNTTALMMNAYRAGASFVVMKTMAFDPNLKGMIPVVSIGVNDKKLSGVDLLKYFKNQGIAHHSGAEFKVNFNDQAEAQKAMEALTVLAKELEAKQAAAANG